MSNVQPHVAEKSATYEVLKQLERSTPWPRVPLTEAVDLNPKPERGSLSDDVEVSFVPMVAVEAGTGVIDTSIVRRYCEVKKGYTYFRDGDVLFAKITPCMENGKIVVARQLRNGIGFGSTEFHVLRPRDGIDALYLYHFVSSARFRAKAAHHMTGAVGQKRVPAAFLEQSEIPLPPIDEQRRIVAEMEKQFSRLDEAVANLKRIKGNLERHKAAVLKAAVEGRVVLTEAELALRERRSFESGEQLLERILAERRAAWDEKAVTTGRNRKYVEPRPPEVARLPVLPKGWAWATLGQLAWSVRDGPHYSPKYVEQGIPFITGGQVRPEGIDFSTAKFISPELHGELSRRCKPELGDMLYTKGGTTGIARVNTDAREFNVWVHVAVLKLVPSIHRFYLQHALNSPHCFRQAQQYTHGVGNQDLGLTRMVWITVPLPPFAEQERIVSEIDRRLSITGEIGRELSIELQRAERLRASALRRVFDLSDNQT